MPTTVGTTARCCANLQIALNNQAAFAPGNHFVSIGMIEALTSPLNTQNFNMNVVESTFSGRGAPDGTSEAKIEVEYLKPNCTEAEDSLEDICGAGIPTFTDQRGYLDVTVSKVSSVAGSFTMEDFNALCLEPQEHLSTMLRIAARAIKLQMDQTLITDFGTTISNYSDGSDSADVAGGNTEILNILNGTGYVNAAEWAKARSEYRKIFGIDNPIIVGGDILAQYEDVRQFAGGVNGASPNLGLNQYVDLNLDGALSALGVPQPGTSFAISWAPGSVQLIEYFENQGYREYFMGQSAKTVIEIDGMRYDYWLLFEECPGPTWKWVLSKRYDLFAIPEAQQGCRPGLTNGNLLWMLGCGPASC